MDTNKEKECCEICKDTPHINGCDNCECVPLRQYLGIDPAIEDLSGYYPTPKQGTAQAGGSKPYNQTDHYHCWEKDEFDTEPYFPPCGQKIEHLKCCLCEVLNPKVSKLLTEARAEGAREAIEDLKDRLSRLEVKATHEVKPEVRDIVEFFVEETKKALLSSYQITDKGK